MEFWISSRHVGALFPPICGGQGSSGTVFIGQNRNGGPCFYNPFELYSSGELTSPNCMVFGQIGYGKSAFVKAILSRHIDIGYRACILDPKGEYSSVTEANLGSVFSFGGRKGTGLNPLGQLVSDKKVDFDLVTHRDLLTNLVLTFAAILKREVSSHEVFVIEKSLLLSEGRSDLLDMSDIFVSLDDLANSQGVDTRDVDIDAKRVAHSLSMELRRYLFGDLIGIIDGVKGDSKSSVELGRLLTLDLYSSNSEEVMTVGVPVFLSLLRKSLTKGSAKYLIVLDEAWMALSSPGCIGFFRSYWKLARGYGIANIAVVHRAEDLEATGDQGSRVQKISSGLVSDSQTFAIFHLDPGPAKKIGEILQLSQIEIALLSTLKRGTCLLKVADRSYLVDVQLTRNERRLFDTDSRMNLNQ